MNVGPNKPISGGGKTRTGLDLLTNRRDRHRGRTGIYGSASYEALLAHCERPPADRVAILDAPEKVADIDLLTKTALAPVGDATGEAGGDRPNAGLRPRQSDDGYGAFYFPWLIVRDPFSADILAPVPPSGHIAGIWARTDASAVCIKPRPTKLCAAHSTSPIT